MTEISCDASVRRRTAGDEDTSCHDPDVEASNAEKEREAEERRNAWAEGSGGSTSRSAATMPGPAGACDMTPEDVTRLRRYQDSVRTQNADPPLEDDPVCNAIPSLVAGGLTAAAQAGASAALSGAGVAAKEAAKAAVVTTAKSVASSVAAQGARASAASLKPAPPLASPEAKPPHASDGAPAGRTGSAATCEPATSDDGGTCTPQAPSGQDRVPYKHGAAPARIPEAPAEAVERPFVAAG